jgi:hypothetical protein
VVVSWWCSAWSAGYAQRMPVKRTRRKVSASWQQRGVVPLNLQGTIRDSDVTAKTFTSPNVVPATKFPGRH